MVFLQVTKSFPIFLMDDILEFTEVQNQQLTREAQQPQFQDVNRSITWRIGPS